MKKIFTLLLLIGITSIGLKAQKKVADFRGLEWGVSLEEAKFDGEENPEFIYRGGVEEKFYIKANEDLTIGTALLEDIFYVFNERNQLYKVILNGKAHANADINFILKERFGKADKRYRKSRSYTLIWTVDNVDVILTEQRSKDFVLQLKSNANIENYMSINSNIDDF